MLPPPTQPLLLLFRRPRNGEGDCNNADNDVIVVVVVFIFGDGDRSEADN
jgi:hypothetical protein